MISKSRIKELSLFLNIDEDFLIQMDKSVQKLPGFAKWINIAIDDWDQSNIDIRDRKKIEGWFKDNDKYIFELSDVHSRAAKQKVINQVLRICKENKVRTLLDYGGGIGEESIRASKKGIKTSMADLPTVAFEFAKWRANYHKVNVDFIKIENDSPLTEKYDAITCFEVLQHLFNPELIAAHLIDHLNPKGLLFITTRFNNPGYSMALPQNLHYDEGMEKFFKTKGMKLLSKIYQYGQGDRKKYLYVYQKSN